MLNVETMVNVWVQADTGESFRADLINSLAAMKVDRKGWCAVWRRPRAGNVVLAKLGRGGRARDGAERACYELPLAIAAGKKQREGCTITFVKAGYPKGGGKWSTLAAPPADVRPIPVVPPGETRQQQRRPGAG